MTPQSQAAFRKWLDEEIQVAKGVAKENLSPFCAGYVSGFLAELQRVEEYFTGGDE